MSSRRRDIRSDQRLAWQNKLGKGFNSTHVPLEFSLLTGEVTEAFGASELTINAARVYRRLPNRTEARILRQHRNAAPPT
jgi:hypothetical protein